ncbi:hypothetical protein MLD38_040653 [Melastoma candidum]|nr:hypothetical protein MLD38_040653 [Melastoma candidum]
MGHHRLLMVVLLVGSFSFFFKQSYASDAGTRTTTSHITVMGMVYCDICSNNTFSTHSYFLPGAEVRIDCKFKVISPKTTEQISFSAKRTTNRYGVYKLDVPAVDGVECAKGAEVVSSCEASLIRSPFASCDVPGYRTTSDEITIKATRVNTCIYSLNPLNYRPSKIDLNLCGR